VIKEYPDWFCNSVNIQTPHSPDLAPCDFWPFPQLMVLQGKRFKTKRLKNIPKNSHKKCFQHWQNRWHKCKGAEGEHFEGE
jgi:hypothetical protein